MAFFQTALLSGSHGIAVEDAGTFRLVVPRLHVLSGTKLCPAIGEQQGDMFFECVLSDNGFQHVHAVGHIARCFCVVEKGEQKVEGEKLEGLNKRTGLLIIDGIHLNDLKFRLCFFYAKIVLVEPILKKRSILALFIHQCFFLGELSLCFLAQIDIQHMPFSKHTASDIVVDGFLAATELGVILGDVVGGLSLANSRHDDRCKSFPILFIEIESTSRLNQYVLVAQLCFRCAIGELGVAAVSQCLATVTGSRRAVTSLTDKWNVIRACLSAVSAMRARSIPFAFQRQLADIRTDSMQRDFFAYRRIILANGDRDGRLGGTMVYALLYDLSSSNVKCLLRLTAAMSCPSFLLGLPAQQDNKPLPT